LTVIGNASFTYDWNSRLFSGARTTDNVQFRYDGLGRCVSRTVNGVAAYITYVGGNPILDTDAAGNVVSRRVYGARTDELIVGYSASGASTYYYHQDHNASVTLITDTSGHLVERYSYDPYGSVTVYDASWKPQTGSSVHNDFLFQGRELLSSLGVYDFNNRAYSPYLGRFLQMDPSRFNGGTNLYGFANNNPITGRDPSGLTVIGTDSGSDVLGDIGSGLSSLGGDLGGLLGGLSVGSPVITPSGATGPGGWQWSVAYLSPDSPLNPNNPANARGLTDAARAALTAKTVLFEADPEEEASTEGDQGNEFGRESLWDEMRDAWNNFAAVIRNQLQGNDFETNTLGYFNIPKNGQVFLDPADGTPFRPDSMVDPTTGEPAVVEIKDWTGEVGAGDNIGSAIRFAQQQNLPSIIILSPYGRPSVSLLNQATMVYRFSPSDGSLSQFPRW
jgi:RHS repeat-associated protein